MMIKRKLYYLLVLCLGASSTLSAQQKATRLANERWQQRAEYYMEIDMDVETNRYQGVQKLKYTNNSPEELTQVFYHLYFNAFQPGSMMDVRSRTISDPDRRVQDRISKLTEEEIGYQKIKSLKQNGKDVKFSEEGTILEVDLNEPIKPGETVTFDMVWEAQVPLQVRRSGRDSQEGVRYSMTQWYPKMSEYDYQGWHAHPYVGREFYGVWGDFEVKISIDKEYMLGGTGYLQNPQEIGHGYEAPGSAVNQKVENGKLTWHFKAPKVHDFAWAADPDFVHVTKQVPGGAMLHFIHQEGQNEESWANIVDITLNAMNYANETFGKYPYKQFTVIQGGDGGMEYPMSTLIYGSRGNLIGVTIHEMMHSWYHGVLGFNETLYPWLDEGFTTYATGRIRRHLRGEDQQPDSNTLAKLGSKTGQSSYFTVVKLGAEEPMTTHSDHYDRNRVYGALAYSKGAVWVGQMGYVIGEEALDKGLLQLYQEWAYKHPNPNDVIRIFEKVSGLELDWYNEYFVASTKTIDYGIQSVLKEGDNTKVTLEKVGKMPMPMDVVVTYKDGTKEVHYAAMRIMRGEKPAETNDKRIIHPDWPWTNPSYEFTVSRPIEDIASVQIDPSGRMADVNQENNKWEAEAIETKK